MAKLTTPLLALFAGAQLVMAPAVAKVGDQYISYCFRNGCYKGVIVSEEPFNGGLSTKVITRTSRVGSPSINWNHTYFVDCNTSDGSFSETSDFKEYVLLNPMPKNWLPHRSEIDGANTWFAVCKRKMNRFDMDVRRIDE